MLLYDHVLKPLFFCLDPERAHGFAMRLFDLGLQTPLVGSVLDSMFQVTERALAREVDGLSFKNPVGLAAGFDKDGRHIATLARLGFGFIEVGTVTPRPQHGNPKPRLYRLPQDQALINRMGFNNAGVTALKRRLEELPSQRDFVLGLNIGKNKDTENHRAVEDYVFCFRELWPYADYFTVNVSSPNTQGLRDLQGKEQLSRILGACQSSNERKLPIYLKIAPDLSWRQIDDILEVAVRADISGIIANNTSISRAGLVTDAEEVEKMGNGGLSGMPILERSDEVLAYIIKNRPEQLTIIASGGVHSAEAAANKLRLGADLVQIYTGLIYQGPTLVRDVLRILAESAL